VRTEAQPRELVSKGALEALPFPREVARGRPWRGPNARGRVYAALAPELATSAPRWLAALAVPEGTALKPPDVYRVGAFVVKLFTQPSLLGWVRPPRAVRSAERYFWCLPLCSPRPLLAVGRPFEARSLLVREHVAGVLLRDAWNGANWQTDSRPEDALAAFLAEMERNGVIHGDLHPRNLLWDGTRWMLLDVDGLRHRLHDPTRVLTGQWARFVLHLGDEQRVQALHRRTTERLGSRARVSWEAVRRRVERLERQRKGVPTA
jgi:hypothetical protein